MPSKLTHTVGKHLFTKHTKTRGGKHLATCQNAMAFVKSVSDLQGVDLVKKAGKSANANSSSTCSVRRGRVTQARCDTALRTPPPLTNSCPGFSVGHVGGMSPCARSCTEAADTSGTACGSAGRSEAGGVDKYGMLTVAAGFVGVGPEI